jgi:transposase-like protein
VGEQRYKAVMAVLSGGRTVTEVARDWEVSRQTMHAWLARYERKGMDMMEGRRPSAVSAETSTSGRRCADLEGGGARVRPGPARAVHWTKRLAMAGADPSHARAAVRTMSRGPAGRSRRIDWSI